MKTDDILHPVLEKLGKKYDCIKRLGGGEYSNVFLVRHHTTGKELALKILDYHYLIHKLRKENLSDSKFKFDEIKKRFVTEANLYKKIDHPNIVKIRDMGVFEDKKEEIEIPYFMMDYVKGLSLDKVIKMEAPFSFERTMRISMQILESLDVIHTAGIVHRDLKPANIMIETETGNAILIDFGIAKDLFGGTKLTTTGALLGSPIYMAPEQFLDSSKASPEMDLYSFGVVCYEMLAGEPPFKGTNFLEIMNAHRRKPIPLLSEKIPGLSEGFDRIFARALAKNTEHRYKTANEFIKALTHKDEKTIPTPNPSPSHEHSLKQYLTYPNILYPVFLLAAITCIAFFLIDPLHIITAKNKEEKHITAKTTETSNSRPEINPHTPNPDSLNAVTAGKSQIPKTGITPQNPGTPPNTALINSTEPNPKDGMTDYSLIKNKPTTAKYIEFKKKFPESPYLQELKNKIKTLDPALPPEKYWDKPIKKNAKGYYEYTFDKEIVSHAMIYIPSRRIWVDKYEVSNFQFKKFLEALKIKPTSEKKNQTISDADEFPAVVTFQEAQKYCKTNNLRLPTQDEWEYTAARNTLTYPWGNEAPDANDIFRANFDSLEGTSEKDGFVGTAPVKSFDRFASPFGAVNMAGNVWEWLQGRLLKGGGIFSSKEDLAVKKTLVGKENDKEGFRCVKDEIESD